MKLFSKIKKNKKLGKLGDLVLFLFVLGIFILSLYKIVVYLNKNFSFSFLGANFSVGAYLEDFASPPLPPGPPEPPCPPPGCCQPSPTDIPEPSPTSFVPTPTEIILPTPTEGEPTLMPTVTLFPSPTSVVERGGNGGLPGAPVCGAETPKAPHLSSAVYLGGDKVKLEWQAVEKATHYVISYGSSSGNYPWGVADTGNTTSFTIEGISQGCFVVKAVNDCAPSEFSNEVCTTKIGQVLGLSTTSGYESGNTYVFWLGLVSLIYGTKIFTLQLSSMGKTGKMRR